MKPENDFRNLLFPLDHPRLKSARGLSAREFGQAVVAAPLPNKIIADCRKLIEVPFRGITCDGDVEEGLYSLADEGAPVGAMTDAALALLSRLDEAKRRQLLYPIDAEQWRVWGNPEFLWNDFGLRLEDLAPTDRAAVLAVISASLSVNGYKKACSCMKMNAFLGELTDLPRILNEYSYNFLIFGTPSESEAWGWNLYGHHLVLNCFVLGKQMVISPTFMGAEPTWMDIGPDVAKPMFIDEEFRGLELMRSLPPELRERATIFQKMYDPDKKAGRAWHPADGWHVGGAFQDNRIVPYEGICASEMNKQQREKLLCIVETFLEYLPPASLLARVRQIEAHLDRTYWSWIGGQGDDDPFYYRVQSPVIMTEFDHHAGIWLNNQEPAKCHIHTVVRTPNGNDYGKDLLRQHYDLIHTGRKPGEN